MVTTLQSTAAPAAGVRPPSVHDRLLGEAKQMFAAYGFDNSSTAAIAKAAGTSESQLVKHFKSKEGLLEAVFDEGWSRISHLYAALEVVQTPTEKLRLLFELILNAFDGDPAWRELVLLEGRRMRKGSSGMMLTPGYLHLVHTIDMILAPLAKSTSPTPGIAVEAIRSALIGVVEGMLRDQVLARRMGFPADFKVEELRRVFGAVLQALLPVEPDVAATPNSVILLRS